MFRALFMYRTRGASTFRFGATLLILLSSPVGAGDAPDPQAILAKTDRARGGGAQGIEWTVHLVTTGGEKTEKRVMLVKANSEASLAETIEPIRFKGSKLLQVQNNMWLGRPGLRKPVPISPRQKLMGQAANGDIAATNYVTEYSATLERMELIENEEAYVLDLKAKSKYSTYDKVRYWVSRSRELGVKAEFFSLSGKLLKTAYFEYDNKLQTNAGKAPFVSRMTIKDAISDVSTVLEYSNIHAKPLSSSTFDVSKLNQ